VQAQGGRGQQLRRGVVRKLACGGCGGEGHAKQRVHLGGGGREQQVVLAQLVHDLRVAEAGGSKQACCGVRPGLGIIQPVQPSGTEACCL